MCDLSLVASSAPQWVLMTNERLKPAPAPCSKWEGLGAFVLGVSNDRGHLEGQGKACVGLRPFQRMFLWSVADMYPPPAGVKVKRRLGLKINAWGDCSTRAALCPSHSPWRHLNWCLLPGPPLPWAQGWGQASPVPRSPSGRWGSCKVVSQHSEQG